MPLTGTETVGGEADQRTMRRTEQFQIHDGHSARREFMLAFLQGGSLPGPWRSFRRLTFFAPDGEAWDYVDACVFTRNGVHGRVTRADFRDRLTVT